MSGFGLSPYGLGPFGLPAADLPAPDPSSLSSSRAIDGVTRTYVLNEQGGFAPMRDVAQRVLLLATRGAGEEPKFIDQTTTAQVEANIRASLEPLTAGPEPSIEIVSITITHVASGTLRRVVVFRDLTNDTEHTVNP